MTPDQKRKLLVLQQQQVVRQSPQPNADGTYGQAPEGMFANPETGQMTERALLQNNAQISGPEAAALGYMQGYSVGTADEMAGGIGRAAGGPEQGQFQRERLRAEIDAAQEQRPGAFTSGQVTGAVLSPVTKVTGPVNTVMGAAKLGAAFSAAEGFAEGEGGFANRALEGAKSAPMGFLFSGLTASLAKGASAGLRRVFQKAEERPTIEALRTAKNAAYKAVKSAGVEFDEDASLALLQRAKRRLQVMDFDEAADPQTAAALRILERRSGEKLTLNRLDKIRQSLWTRYARSDEPGVLALIGEIDTTIERAAEGNELLMAARAANSKYAKAELLENAFRKARLQTASTGSGGNILNKYRQAVTRIITTPREARWFSADELALMEQFVEGDVSENTLRRIGKLAPGGNGLMTALNVYAASVDPSLLAITGAATVAKEAADTSAMKGSERILDAVSTGVIAQPRQSAPLNRLAVGSGAAANALAPF